MFEKDPKEIIIIIKNSGRDYSRTDAKAARAHYIRTQEGFMAGNEAENETAMGQARSKLYLRGQTTNVKMRDE